MQLQSNFFEKILFALPPFFFFWGGGGGVCSSMRGVRAILSKTSYSFKTLSAKVGAVYFVEWGSECFEKIFCTRSYCRKLLWLFKTFLYVFYIIFFWWCMRSLRAIKKDEIMEAGGGDQTFGKKCICFLK